MRIDAIADELTRYYYTTIFQVVFFLKIQTPFYEKIHSVDPEHNMYHSVYSCRCTQQGNVVFYVHADLCSLLTATSQFNILIGQNMQLTGCHNGNEMRNATCADTQISVEWPYCSFSILRM